MQNKRGFTLIELLVVVAVIAVLAGLLIPAISLIRRLANDVKCGNNLRQVGTAITAYSLSRNDEKFPDRLRNIVETGGDFVGLRKILLCPRDPNNGTGGYNRPWDPVTNVDLFNEESPAPTPGVPDPVRTSYLYECSVSPVTPGNYTYFYQFSENGGPPTTPPPSPLPSWLVAKGVQLRTGNFGDPFPRALMPIIRCFWHGQFSSNSSLKKVKNISWDLNVFESTPSWESDINPAFTP